MPTYQYACTQCQHSFDAVQSFTDDPLTQCPECEGRLRKLFNSVGIVFKGSGFYRTDSREKPSSDKPSDNSAAKTEPATTGNSDSKSRDRGSSAPTDAPAKTDAAAKADAPAKKPGPGSSTTGSAA